MVKIPEGYIIRVSTQLTFGGHTNNGEDRESSERKRERHNGGGREAASDDAKSVRGPVGGGRRGG